MQHKIKCYSGHLMKTPVCFHIALYIIYRRVKKKRNVSFFQCRAAFIDILLFPCPFKPFPCSTVQESKRFCVWYLMTSQFFSVKFFLLNVRTFFENMRTVPMQSRPLLQTNHLLILPSAATEKRASTFSSPVKFNSCLIQLSCQTGPKCLLGHSLHRVRETIKKFLQQSCSVWDLRTANPHLLLMTHDLVLWLCTL